MVKRLLALGLCACSGGGGRHAAATEEAAHTVKVAKGEIVDRVVLTGSLEATHAEEMRVPRTDAWELPIRWMAEDGVLVKQGDRALEFDNAQFTAQLQQQKLAVLDAIINYNTFLGTSELQVQDKQFALDSAKIAHDKAKVLAAVPADILPARTYQERQLDFKRTERAVDRAEKDLAATKAAVSLDRQVKQIELDKAKSAIEHAEKSIDALTIKAPRDGIAVIGEHPWEGRKYQVGDTVQPGWTIVSLPEFAAGMEVHADLSDVDDGRINVGMIGNCTLDAYPTDPLPCVVKELMPVASGGRESLRRAFAVVLTIDKFDRDRMIPGMAVKVELRRQPLAAVVVPRSAVRFDEAGKTTRVRLASGETKDIELGPCDAQGCAVTSGLVENDSIVVGGPR
jgi:multidrug efflux pump subunit AcrA (membrane-fusion protein)